MSLAWVFLGVVLMPVNAFDLVFRNLALEELIPPWHRPLYSFERSIFFAICARLFICAYDAMLESACDYPTRRFYEMHIKNIAKLNNKACRSATSARDRWQCEMDIVSILEQIISESEAAERRLVKRDELRQKHFEERRQGLASFTKLSLLLSRREGMDVVITIQYLGKGHQSSLSSNLGDVSA